MNVRKPGDYGTMHRELTAILAQNLPQMNEIHAIGKVIHQRPEKGAAVAAAEFLQANFPDRTGFSPRNVRRMRDFYRTYENDQTLLRLAMKLGWTLNVVIMEAELTREARKWYLEQTQRRGWTKAELQAALEAEAYDVQREETEIMKPIKAQIARKLHMLKTRFLFNVACICEKRLTSKSSPGRSEDLRYSDACLDGRCSIVYLLFLIFSATISSWGGLRDVDERERISENSRTGQAGDPYGAVPRGDLGKLRAASAVSRHRHSHQRA